MLCLCVVGIKSTGIISLFIVFLFCLLKMLTSFFSPPPLPRKYGLLSCILTEIYWIFLQEGRMLSCLQLWGFVLANGWVVFWRSLSFVVS